MYLSAATATARFFASLMGHGVRLPLTILVYPQWPTTYGFVLQPVLLLSSSILTCSCTRTSQDCAVTTTHNFHFCDDVRSVDRIHFLSVCKSLIARYDVYCLTSAVRVKRIDYLHPKARKTFGRWTIDCSVIYSMVMWLEELIRILWLAAITCRCNFLGQDFSLAWKIIC